MGLKLLGPVLRGPAQLELPAGVQLAVRGQQLAVPLRPGSCLSWSCLSLCGTTSAGGTRLNCACLSSARLSLRARLTRLGCGGTGLTRLCTLNCTRLVCCSRRALKGI